MNWSRFNGQFRETERERKERLRASYHKRLAAVAAEPAAEAGATELSSADAELRAACAAMLADYQTSEHHHPRHVLVSLAAFEAMRAALRLAEGTEAAQVES